MGKHMRTRLAAAPAAAAALVLAGACAGCGPGPLYLPLSSREQFRGEVLGSPRPAVVLFHSPFCSRCMLSYGALDGLADEFKGRVGFYHAAYRGGPGELLQEQHIELFPTVVLYAGGAERKRCTDAGRLGPLRDAIGEALRR